MIRESTVLSDLIGTIYDTTLDRALWPDVIRRSAEFVGGSASSLYSKNVARRTGNLNLCWSPRFEAAALPSYFDEYVRIDPSTTCQFMFDVGQVYSMGDCMPYAAFQQTRVYKEWARPLGLADQLAATLDKSATSFSLFAVFRDEGQGRADD
jgi:hypothetical protein